ncbi:MAG: diacylglycerol kinase family lipid kinase [Chloroflexi bacterium]|nr:diacylglycerol kinase family lipid kinase [Chloroflexota bacterium]
MRIKLILNPRSDNGRGHRYKALLEAAARPYGSLDIVITERSRHATQLARQAAAEGVDLVAAAGGDGTVSEIVNGLMQGEKATTRLGIIPIGSGNDLAWSLGVSTEVETAVKTLFTGQPQAIDLARVTDDKGRVYIIDNNMGIGFDARVVLQTEKISRIHGFLKYMIATLQTIAFYYDMPRLHLIFDEEEVTQKIFFVTFGLGKRHGGGYLITPQARHHDNLIDTCTVTPISRPTMLAMMPKVMKGMHVTHPAVTMRQNRRIVVKSDEPMIIHTDGEMFAYPQDDIHQVTVASLPNAIEVMTPVSHKDK